MRQHPRGSSQPTLAALFASLALSVLAGCGGDDPDRGPDRGPVGSRSETAQGGDARTLPTLPDDPPTARRATLDDLRADHAAPRHPSDGGGRAWLELGEGEDGSIQAGRRGTWTILYEAGELGVAVGGSVRFLTPPFWEWSSAQDRFPDQPGYITVESLADGVTLDVIAGDWTVAEIRGRALRSGERLRFVYGAGEAGARADRYAERGAPLWLSVDGDGDRVPGILLDSPRIDILPGPPLRLHLNAPSVVRPGEEVVLRASVLDRVGNRGVTFEGDVQLAIEEGAAELPETVRLSAEHAGTVAIPFTCAAPGVVRIRGRVALADREIEAIANPILVSPVAPRVFWGDLHGHSHVSDGTGAPQDYFTYARDVAGLDVLALTDHDHWGVVFLDQDPEQWRELQALAERFYEPNRFVTLAGYEWTSWIHGHRHVLFFDPGEHELLSSIDPAFETPQQLWDGLAARDERALTFAHHSAGGPIATDWSFAPDPRFEPVTEIVSVHGCSEARDAPKGIYRPLRGNYVRDVLDRGYRLGFLGSGDSHDGHPGLVHLASSGGGLAGVLAEDLTRDGVYAALQARRSYATNGRRILLQTALGGARMGALVPEPSSDTTPLYVRVIAVTPLATLDLVRSGRVQSIDAEGRLELVLEFEIPELTAGEYVYVRAVQEDGFAAWSSPFFIVGNESDAGRAEAPNENDEAPEGTVEDPPGR